jgi:transcriptional regulator with XRE-family HTH domain
MKSPITGRPMSLLIDKSILVFRKENFEYSHKSYYCKDSEQNFTTRELDEFNLNQVYNQYRDKHNIPFPDEVKEFRENYSFSYADITKILGLGANSYRNYENGEVPSLANSALIKAVMGSSDSLKGLIKTNNDISEKQREKFLKNIEKIQLYQEKNKRENAFIEMIYNYNFLPDNFSGYKKPSFTKLAQMVMYFSEKVEPTVTKMNKLLFYADFSHYKLTGVSISGTRYIAHNYGPVPDRFRTIFDYLVNNDYIKAESFQYEGYVGENFVKSDQKSLDRNLLEPTELKVLDEISQKFMHLTATKTMDLSHEEDAWINNEKKKDLIDYNYSFTLKNI